MKLNQKKPIYMLLVSLSILRLCFAGTTDSANPLTITPLPGGVSIYQLDNGMQILLIENCGLPMIGVNIVVKTGSAYETFSTSGMSHMLEHLLFNGTSSLTQKELYDAVDLIGGYNNANTGQYYTNFMMVTPSENIRQGMKIQADMLFNSILPKEKFEKEKGIVLEEIARSLENDDEQMTRNEQEILFAGHALSLPTLGTYTTIQSMNREIVYDYYKNNYVPNNMVMSVVGNFSTDSMRTFINEIYGHEAPKIVDFQKNLGLATGFQRAQKNLSIERGVYQRFYGGNKLFLQLFYQLSSDWQEVHFVIAEEIFSKERSNLIKDLKEKYPEIEESLKFEIKSSPLKNYLKITVNIIDRNKMTKISNDINQVISKINLKLPAESLDYLAKKSRTTFFQNIEKPHMFGIYNAHIFAERGIEAVMSSYDSQAYLQAATDLAGYKIGQEPLILIQSPAKNGEEVGTGQVAKAKKYIDPASDMIVIAEQNSGSELLAIHFLLKYKALYDARFGKDAAKILHDCLGERLQSVENQKISNQFGLSYTVNDNPFIPMDNIYLDPDFGYIRVEGLADDIAGVINYLKDQIGGFVPTAEEYQKALAKTKMPMMGMGSSQSSNLFEKAWENQVYEEEKYPVNPQVVAYEQLVKMAAFYFHPSNMIISVVSPAAGEEIFNLFNWNIPCPADSGSIARMPYVRKLKATKAEAREEVDGGGERSFLFWGFVKQVEKSDQAALQVLGLMLADYIVFEIREKQGRAYRMKAGIDLIGEKALFYINLGTRPDNINPIAQQAPELFDSKTVDSFTDFDLQKSLNMYLGRMMFRRLSSINRAYYLGHSEYFYSDMTYDSQFLSRLKKVTRSDIKKVAEKYMMINNPVTVIVR